MTYEVILRLHKGESTGELGLCHKQHVGNFYAFWSPGGIFHDVFEHYFEGVHPYFNTANTELSMYGEMVASGHALAYSAIGIDNFRFRKRKNSTRGRDFIIDTTSQMEDWLEGYSEDPEYSIDKCVVPYTRYKGIYSDYLNMAIHQYEDWWHAHLDKGHRKIKQVPLNRIRNCYHWGFRRGMQIIGKDHIHAYSIMDDFLDQWHTITKGDPEKLCIYDEYVYPLRDIKFVVKSAPKLSVKTLLVDEVGNEYKIEKLYNHL